MTFCFVNMGLTCGAQCAKYILFAFNVIFWLSGAAFIAVGAYIAADKDLKLLGDHITSGDHLKIAAYVIIAIGVITFIVGFCGCCGAIKENQCLLGTYILLLSIILIMSLAIGIYAAVKKDDLIKAMKDRTKKMIQVNYPPIDQKKDGANFKKVIDDLQLEGKCCGVDSRDEWKESKWYKASSNNGKYPFPPSCCGNKNGNYSVVKNCETKNTYHKAKCSDYIENLIKSKAPILIGIACGVAALEIFGIIFASCLCRSIRHEYDA